jgi:hypothetical protein
MCRLPELQGVQVQGGLHQIQGEQGVQGDQHRAVAGCREKEVDSLLPFLCLTLDPDGQLPPGQEVHGDTGAATYQVWQSGGVNSQFYDTVKLGVFWKLSLKEMTEYTSPVNYITMEEALKNGPHTNTLLCICLNSSLKQLLLSGRSLNDCLSFGEPVHCHCGHSRVPVHPDQGLVQVLPEGGDHQAGPAHEESDLVQR